MNKQHAASKRASARKHLNKAEFELFKNSKTKSTKELTAYRIKQKINAVTKAIGKYSTQKRSSKQARKTKGLDLQARSIVREKLTFLKEALAAYKTALKEKTSKAKSATKGKKAIQKKANKKASKKLKAKVMGAIGELEPTKINRKKISPSNFKEKRLLRAGVLRKQGHAQARTQRKQGKRDSR